MSADPRHPLRHERERRAGDLGDADRNRLRFIDIDRARVVRDAVTVVWCADAGAPGRHHHAHLGQAPR